MPICEYVSNTVHQTTNMCIFQKARPVYFRLAGCRILDLFVCKYSADI